MQSKSSSATGMIANLADLDAFVQREVLEEFDHKSLNEDVPAFREKVPTTENLCMEIFQRLKNFPRAKLERVRVEDAGTLRESPEVPDQRLPPKPRSRSEWRDVQRGLR